jgi:hypothetical protein
MTLTTSKFEAYAKRMAINFGRSMNFTMRKLFPLVNIEDDQKFDYALVKRLAKIIKFLPNLED